MADLDDGHVHGRVGELPDGHGGEHLEEAHLRLALLLHLGVHQGHEILGLVPDVDEIGRRTASGRRWRYAR